MNYDELLTLSNKAKWEYFKEPKHKDAELCWNVIDKFLSTKSSTGDFVNEILGDPDPRTHYNVTQRLNNFVGFMLAHRLCDAESRDELVRDIAQSPKRGFETAIFSNANIVLDKSAGLLRSQNKDLYPVEFFKKTQSKTTLKILLAAAAYHDDGDAIELLKTVPNYLKALTGKNIETVLKGIDIKPSSKVFDALTACNGGDNKEIDPFQYLNILISLNSKNSIESAQNIYKPDLSQHHGHALIDHCIRKGASQAQLSIIARTVSDGADWYLAFKQATVSPSIYLDLEGREADSVNELREMITTWKDFPAPKRNASVLAEILKGLPAALIEEAAKEPGSGKIITRILKRNDRMEAAVNEGAEVP